MRQEKLRQMTTLDSAESLEALVVTVHRNLEAATVLLTRVTEQHQSVLAHAGHALPDWFLDEAPLDFSICQHSAAMDFPLVIDDALTHPLMRGNRAVSELNVAAYIGAPVHVPPGTPIGAICALEFHQRRWSENDVRFITDAARRADTLLADLS